MGGTPALEQDSIHSLFSKLPLMVVLLITTTTILMFLAFGSLVLPIKAALMSALTLGSTMGVLTWIFVDGHFSHLLNFTPQPLMAPMIGLIIAVIYGLSTDYEVFLVSRMVEARERGMSTAEAIRIGTATTGRLITAAALILAVVAGAFAFSDLVMMKYLAFGLLIALLLDATVIRMFLVPAIMKLLGDDCWWAPRWMKRLQERLGLGELDLPDERKRPAVREPEEALVGAGAPVRPRPVPPHDPTHPAVEGSSRPGARPDQAGAAAGQRAVGRGHHPDAHARAARPPMSRPPPGCRWPRTPCATSSTMRPRPRSAPAPDAAAAPPPPAPAAAPPPAPAPTRPGGSRNRVVAGRIAGHQRRPAPPVPPPHPQPSADATRAIPAGRSEATRGSDAEQRQRPARKVTTRRPPSSGRRTPRRPRSSTPGRRRRAEAPPTCTRAATTQAAASAPQDLSARARGRALSPSPARPRRPLPP